jgi:hypothetical protein
MNPDSTQVALGCCTLMVVGEVADVSEVRAAVIACYSLRRTFGKKDVRNVSLVSVQYIDYSVLDNKIQAYATSVNAHNKP